MNRKKPLHPDAALIVALGDTFEVARICRVKPPSVSEWKQTGIPDARRQYLELLRPDIFGEPVTDAEAA